MSVENSAADGSEDLAPDHFHTVSLDGFAFTLEKSNLDQRFDAVKLDHVGFAPVRGLLRV